MIFSNSSVRVLGFIYIVKLIYDIKMVSKYILYFNKIKSYGFEFISKRYISDFNKIKYMVLKLFQKGYILDLNKIKYMVLKL